ncbi:MAG TPA: histidine kinase, partial [Puia sp.]|nr:histidine kinase [Puia sp.]
MTHVLIWGVFALAIFLYRPLLSASDIPYQFWIRQTVTLTLLVIAFYVNAFLLVPRFLLKNQFFLYFLITIALLGAVVFIHEWVDTALDASRASAQVLFLRRGGPMRRPPLGRGWHIDVLIIVISAFVIGIGTSITAIQKWQADKDRREELEKDKVMSELSFLKAQVSPHFFFNTLNNI